MNTNDKDNPSSFLAPVSDQGGGMLEVAASRAAQEIQAAMVIAKRFPRSEAQAYSRVIDACKRKGLAEEAAYSFPRGGTTVTGPSIRLAETLARCWGNIESGIIELERKDGESTMMAFAWDLETNARSSRVFSVAHLRDTRNGTKALEDQRDIYELTANQGARRVRACILAVIPGDIVDAALEQCDKTIAGDKAEPLIDRVRKMVVGFEELGVTPQMLEKRLGHVLDKTSENELVGLRRIFKTIRDNFKSKDEFFDVTAVATSTPKKPDTTRSAPVTDAHPQAQSPDAGQTQAANPPASAEPPPSGKDVLYDADKPVESLASMMKRDSLTDHQVVEYCKTLGLASKSVKKPSEIREANIRKLCETWSSHADKIKAVPAGE